MRRQGRSLWRLILLGSIVALVTGCAADTAHLDHALLADQNPAAHGGDLMSHYVAHCPDVLAIHVANRPEWTGLHPINVDGRIILDDAEFPRVDGRTVPEIARLLAEKSGAPASQVQVHVAEYNSQRIYILSEAPGLQQVVAYQGPETIVELLQRAGGVAQGGTPRDIQVVRSHVADGKSPEVFHVDLDAIVLKHDQRTNVQLESFDQIYIGETRGSCVWACIPPWLRPFFQESCGMGP